MSTIEEKQKVFPAAYQAHWPNQSVFVCEKHNQDLIRIATAMGFVLISSLNRDAAKECLNCRREAGKEKA